MDTTNQVSAKRAYGDILRLMLPCLFELFLGQLASIVDTMMVGGMGTQAITAVGICGNPMTLLTMIFASLNVGTTALISRAKGEGDIRKVNLVAKQAWIINGAAGLLMMSLGLLLSRSLVLMMGVVNEQTAALAIGYLRIRIFALPAIAIATANSAILRGVGNSRTPMTYNLVANAINILFNWLLINGILFFPKMGVHGAAAATAISNAASMLISCLLLLRGHGEIQIALTEKWEMSTAMLSNIFRINAPKMAEQIIMQMGNTVFSRLLVSMGEVDYAAHQLCWSLLGMLMQCGAAMQMAISPLAGQCLGRKEPKQVEIYVKHGIIVLLVVMTFFGLICIFLGRYILLLYSPEPDVLAVAAPLMALFGVFLPSMAPQYVYGGALAGAGDTKYNAPIFIVTMIAVRIPVAYFFREAFHWGVIGANISMMIDILLRWLLFGLRYKSGKWKTVKLRES